MKKILLLLSLALFASTPRAQTQPVQTQAPQAQPTEIKPAPPTQPIVTTAEEDRILFLRSLEYQARAGICASNLTDFGDKLKPLLRRWTVRNEARLRVGDAFFRAEAARDLVQAEDDLDRYVHDPIDKMKSESAGDLQKDCDDVLYFYGPNGPYSERPKPKKKADAAAQTPPASAPATAP
ncbi:MAG TPA: hypothetical protein VL550_00135 [Rhodocyclaceae bacterium]|nr:hypothetical protein [Rhodocyclaceae bacterium]